MSGTLITELEEGNAKGACSCSSGHGPAALGSREKDPKEDFKNHSSITNQFLSFHNTFSSFGVTGTASPNFEIKGQQIPNWSHPPGKQKLITHRIFLWHKQLMLQTPTKAVTGPGARTAPTTHGVNKLLHHDPNTKHRSSSQCLCSPRAPGDTFPGEEHPVISATGSKRHLSSWAWSSG